MGGAKRHGPFRFLTICDYCGMDGSKLSMLALQKHMSKCSQERASQQRQREATAAANRTLEEKQVIARENQQVAAYNQAVARTRAAARAAARANHADPANPGNQNI